MRVHRRDDRGPAVLPAVTTARLDAVLAARSGEIFRYREHAVERIGENTYLDPARAGHFVADALAPLLVRSLNPIL